MTEETTTETREESEGPRLPRIGEYVRTIGKLIAVENVTPPVVEVIDYIFERIEARVECRVNGNTFKHYGTFNEFYGPGTAVSAAIEEAKMLAKKHGKSDLEFVAIKVTSQSRMRPESNKSRTMTFDDKFRYLSRLERYDQWGLPEAVEELVFSIKNTGNEELK